MSDAFARPLVAYGRCPDIPEECDLYGRFVGEWDFEWIDGKGTPDERRVKGEWIFSWILEGKAVQDVFICPSREEREKKTYPDAEYGTTVRIYVPEKRCWNITYIQRGIPQRFEGRLDEEGNIVQTLINKGGYDAVWKFSEITDSSFHWTNNMSRDGGGTWFLVGELYAVKRGKKS